MNHGHWPGEGEDCWAIDRPVAVLAMTLGMVFMAAFALMLAGTALPMPVHKAITSVPSLPEAVVRAATTLRSGANSPLNRKEGT